MHAAALTRASTVADSEFYRDVAAGLSRAQKTLPCKYFYDDAGSALFERICELEEYYVTRTEIAIFLRYLPEMAALIGPRARVLEFGAGAGIKTQLLLEALERPETYIPIEISASALAGCTQSLARAFPDLTVKPVHADYMSDSLFDRLEAKQPLTVFFPGSTLGNFTPTEAHAFLCRMRRLAGPQGGILIGVDLMKSDEVLIPAYNDRAGVTAAFNKNLLVRINRELDADFNVNGFSHVATVNRPLQRVEMHLMSLTSQTVRVGDAVFYFRAGETIHTENSHKYTLPGFQQLVETAGLRCVRTWTDAQKLYSVHYLTAA